MGRSRLGLRARLVVALVVVVVIAVAASLTVSLRVLDGYVEGEAARDLEAGHRTLGRLLDLQQRLVLEHALSLAARDELRSALAAGRRGDLLALARRALQESELDLVTVTDASGVVLVRGHLPDVYGDDASNGTAVASALRGRPVATIRRAPDVPLVTSAAAPVFDGRPPYRLLGAVAAGAALDRRFVHDARQATGLDVSLVLDGRRVFTTLPAGTPEPAAADLAGRLAPGRLEARGEGYHVGYWPFQGRESAEPVATIELARPEQALATARRRTAILMTGALGAAGLAVLGLALWIGARLTEPLRRLAAAAEALGTEKAGRRLELAASGEVGELAVAFNRMGDRIDATLAALRASEQRYRDLVENAPVAVLSIGSDGRVTHANPAAAALFGCDRPGDLEGRAIADLCAPAPAGRTGAADVVRRLQAGEDVRGEELEIHRGDAAHGWVSLAVNAIRDAAGGVVGGRAIAVDVTEQRRARDIALGLTGVARALASTLDVAAARALIVRTATELLAVEYAAIWAPAEGPGDLVRVAAHATEGPPDDWALALPIGSGAGLLGAAMRERQVLVSGDVLADPRVVLPAEARARLEGSRLRAALAVPLFAGDRLLGALFARTRTGQRFSAEQIALARALGDHAALSLERARLFEDATRREREAVALQDLGRRIGESLDLDTILPRVADAARALADADGAFLAVRERPGDTHVTVRYDSGVAAETVRGVAVRPGEGLGGRVLESGRPLRSDDYVRDHARTAPRLAEVARRLGVTAMMAVPVLAEQRIVGLVYVLRRTARPFTDRDEATLVRLAGVAGPAIANAMLYQEAREARQRLAMLSGELLQLQETERQQLARELHDELGQALTALRINLELLVAPGAVEAGRLGESLGIVNRLVDQVRGLALALRPAILDDLGLDAAVPWLVRSQAERAGLAATVDVAVGEPRPGTDVETGCFRIVQEAVTNVVRHAGARRLTVQVRREGDRLHLLVRDDGTGFDVAGARDRGRGGAALGLLGIEERTRLLGGHVEIASAPGSGTSVVAWLPLRRPDAGASLEAPRSLDGRPAGDVPC